MIATFAFVTSMMAMSPQWAIIDLPYPEIGYEAAAPATASRITEAVANYQAKHSGKSLNRKPEVSDLRVNDSTASLRVTTGDRTEVMILSRTNNDWRVIQCLVDGLEY